MERNPQGFMERLSVSDPNAFMRKLKELEAKLPGAQIKGGEVQLNININAQVPFKQVIEKMQDEVLYKMLDELRAELNRRGLRE